MANANDAIDLFMKYDYAEVKDLLKTLLSLVSGTLVFSVTFGEKIVGIKGGNRIARNCLFCSWVSLILSLILAGIAVVSLVMTAGDIVYGDGLRSNYLALRQETFTIYVSVGAGVAFVCGLLCIALAGFFSMRAATQ